VRILAVVPPTNGSPTNLGMFSVTINGTAPTDTLRSMNLSYGRTTAMTSVVSIGDTIPSSALIYNLTDLTRSAIYYYEWYWNNGGTRVGCGIQSIVTKSGLATVTTIGTSSITKTSAIFSGNITTFND
jgi:hypothetical protein